ncbi:hypothetical protein G6F58_013680 [Rhizopus delemar]|nr:hypothetical protein G6F58_013680 [Rhizopus delemar]
MALHVDQALTHGDPDTVREALQHIRRLNQRTARVSTQLLALSRAQTVPDTVEALDLCELVPQWQPAAARARQRRHAAGGAGQPDRQRPALCRP